MRYGAILARTNLNLKGSADRLAVVGSSDGEHCLRKGFSRIKLNTTPFHSHTLYLRGDRPIHAASLERAGEPVNGRACIDG